MLSSHKSVKWAVTAIAVVAAVMLISAAALAGPVLYVDDDAPPVGDGTSWDSAYRFLQDALTDASAGGITEIRVAQGTYQPDRDEANPTGTGNRESTFQLINGVALRGGYLGLSAGKGQDPDDRDIELYETTLSGDLLGNDGPDFANNDENSFHVTTGIGTFGTAVLDGFTVTAGNADGSFQDGRGGGMTNNGSSPTVTNCTFSGNSADDSGGGMVNVANSSPIVSNCTFTGNTAPFGAGMNNFIDSSPNVTSCTFSGNTADVDGGGMGNFEGSSPVVTNCTFSGNEADFGGGMFNFDNSNPRVIGSTFDANTATMNGAGMMNANESSPTVTNCTFTGNAAPFGVGGGMRNAGSSSPTVTNCTFTGNTASVGGGMHNRNGNPTVTNCILWGDSPDEISGPATVRYSDVAGDFAGLGNIDADPLFVDPVNGDYHLASGSPCADAGNNWGVPIDAGDYDGDGNTAELFPVDLDGNPRFNADEADFDPGCGVPVVVDMGAYEYQFAPVEDVIFADLNADGAVGILDLLALLAGWGDPGTNCLGDLDIDGEVDIFDLLTLLAHWS